MMMKKWAAVYFGILFGVQAAIAAENEELTGDTSDEPIPEIPEFHRIPVFRVDSMPDGGAVRDSVWFHISAVIQQDSQPAFYCGMLCNDTDIIISLSIPSKTPDNAPAEWLWNTARNTYLPVPSEELTLKLFLTRDPIADVEFADCWMWYAQRSGEAGYADDYHYRREARRRDLPDSPLSLLVPDTKWTADTGEFGWRSRYYGNRVGTRLKRFFKTAPLGSAGDVRTRAYWEKGYWTIEFYRSRNTGHDDDVLFTFEDPILFQFSVTAKDPKKSWTSPVMLIPSEEESEINYRAAEGDVDSRLKAESDL